MPSISPLLVLAHEAAPAGNLWLAWNLDPVLVLGIAAFTGLYFYALGPLRRRHGWSETVSRAHVAYFVAGTLVFALALISPLDTLGDDYLFSAHMVQHMLIAVVAPPLWLLGTPEWMLAPLFRRRSVLAVARLLTHPAVAFALFNGDLWLWHLPVLYDATLENEAVHIFEHLTFVATAVLFWAPVICAYRPLRQLSPGAAVLYLFVACQPMVALGALLTFSAAPLYQPYVEAPHIWGSTPLGDQQLGGLIMWLPTNIPYVIALSALFFKWVGIQDRQEREAAGELDAAASDAEPLTTDGASPSPSAARAEAPSIS